MLAKRPTRAGPDVTLSTVDRVRLLLETARVPVSRNWLLQQLRASGHTTSRQRLNRALSFLEDLELVVEGSKGVQWTHSTSESLRRAVATGRAV